LNRARPPQLLERLQHMKEQKRRAAYGSDGDGGLDPMARPQSAVAAAAAAVDKEVGASSEQPPRAHLPQPLQTLHARVCSASDRVALSERQSRQMSSSQSSSSCAPAHAVQGDGRGGRTRAERRAEAAATAAMLAAAGHATGVDFSGGVIRR
jgi:hypothetical protein